MPAFACWEHVLLSAYNWYYVKCRTSGIRLATAFPASRVLPPSNRGTLESPVPPSLAEPMRFSGAHGGSHARVIHGGRERRSLTRARGAHASTQCTPYGRAGDPAKARGVDVRRCETVRLLVANDGKLVHERVLGTAPALRKHAQAMRDHPAMAHHDDLDAAHVPPGARAELVWDVRSPRTVQLRLPRPGHVEAGMVGTVVVR